MSKLQRDFRQLSTSIANISGMERRIVIAVNQLHFIPCSPKKFGELWSTNKKVIGAHVDPPNWTFSGDYISAVSGWWVLARAPQIFTCPTSLVNCIFSRTWGAGRPRALSHISSLLLKSN